MGKLWSKIFLVEQEDTEHTLYISLSHTRQDQGFVCTSTLMCSALST